MVSHETDAEVMVEEVDTSVSKSSDTMSDSDSEPESESKTSVKSNLNCSKAISYKSDFNYDMGVHIKPGPIKM